MGSRTQSWRRSNAEVEGRTYAAQRVNDHCIKRMLVRDEARQVAKVSVKITTKRETRFCASGY